MSTKLNLVSAATIALVALALVTTPAFACKGHACGGKVATVKAKVEIGGSGHGAGDSGNYGKGGVEREAGNESWNLIDLEGEVWGTTCKEAGCKTGASFNGTGAAGNVGYSTVKAGGVAGSYSAGAANLNLEGKASSGQ